MTMELLKKNKNMLSSRILKFVIVTNMFLLSCGGAYRASTVNRVPLEETNTVVYQDIWLKATVGIMRVDAQNKNGYLMPRLRLKNLTNKQVDAEILVKFLDSEGYELDDTGWDPLPFEPGEIKSYSKIAINKDARDYRFILKTAGN